MTGLGISASREKVSAPRDEQEAAQYNIPRNESLGAESARRRSDESAAHQTDETMGRLISCQCVQLTVITGL